MNRPHDFRSPYAPAGLFQRSSHQAGVENVMVQTAVLGIAPGAGAEFLGRAGVRVAPEVVVRENLVEVGEVVLARALRIVGAQMLQGRERAGMVEGADRIRQEQHEASAGTYDAPPFAQRRQRVRHVLEAMGRKGEVVGAVRDAGERCRFAEELPGRRTGGIEPEFPAFTEAGLPRGGGREVHVVDAFGAGIDRKDAAAGKHAARPANFQTGAVRHRGQHRRAQRGPRRYQAIEHGRREPGDSAVTKAGQNMVNRAARWHAEESGNRPRRAGKEVQPGGEDALQVIASERVFVNGYLAAKRR